MTIVFREARAEDADAIFALHCAAFPTHAEARLVVALVAEGDALLSHVADREGVVVGHVLFSRMTALADGKPVSAAALAPVAVLPAFQTLGIGSGLIDHGIAALAETIQWLFVLGEPEFYERFGFDVEAGARFASPYAGEQWMALSLEERKPPRRGEARHAPAFSRLEDAA